MVFLSRNVSFVHFQRFFGIGKFISWQGYWSECFGYRFESAPDPRLILSKFLMIFVKSLRKAWGQDIEFQPTERKYLLKVE